MGNKVPRVALTREQQWGDFVSLPNELLLHVLGYLSPKPLCQVERLNTAWNQLVNDGGVWRSTLDGLLAQESELFTNAPGRDDVQLYVQSAKDCKSLIKDTLQMRKASEERLSFLPDELKPGARTALAKAKVGKLIINGKEEKKFLMIGLDAAGKTTMLYMLNGEPQYTLPTIGFNIEQTGLGRLCVYSWDVGGPDKIRPLWRHYYRGVQALILVVDLNDWDRISEARDELHRMLNEPELDSIPLLVYGNKIDLPRAMQPDAAISQLGLDKIRNRLWYLQPTCALSGAGVYEGLSWLATADPKPRK